VDSNKLFVGGISYSATHNDIKEEFSKYGKVENIKVPISDETGLIRGYCFITMSSSDEASSIIEKLDGSKFMGRIIGVKPYKDKRNNGNR